jgi:hypothetical protein
MYTLILFLAWSLPTDPLVEIQDATGLHQVYLRTHSGSVTIPGFSTWHDCQNFKFNVPVTLNGVPMPYTVSERRCVRD